jgi:oxygen-independent coproporphyrinogen III oxidase
LASVYIHIPFCERKCFYCDFYSVTGSDQIGTFLSVLRREIELSSTLLENDTVETIFFGGGTPSLLTPSQIGKILNEISRVANVATDAETTIEVNPGTIDKQKLYGYLAAGINRLSVGVQSFTDDELRFLQRIHSSGESVRAILDARECGFENLSIDLIYALPNQTPAQWRTTLEKALSFHPHHISAYSLIVEDGTPLAASVSSKEIIPLSGDEEASLYLLTMEVLAEAGYIHYEVSNYAKPGYNCRHNSNYWNHKNYIGFGPSAHSYLNGRRWWNIRDFQNYSVRLSGNKPVIAGEEILTERQLLEETIMLELRTGELNFSRLRQKFGVDLWKKAGPLVRSMVDENLMSPDGDYLRLTMKGYLLCDEITERLLSAL